MKKMNYFTPACIVCEMQVEDVVMEISGQVHTPGMPGDGDEVLESTSDFHRNIWSEE